MQQIPRRCAPRDDNQQETPERRMTFFADRTDSDQNAIRGDSREFENSDDLELMAVRENLATASAEGKTRPSSRIRDLQITARTNAQKTFPPRTAFETNAQFALNFECG